MTSWQGDCELKLSHRPHSDQINLGPMKIVTDPVNAITALELLPITDGVGGLGVVLRAMAIKESIAEGLNGYDFLGGVEEFKTRWNTITRYVQRVRMGAPGLEGAAAFSLSVYVLKAKDWAREQVPHWLLNARRQVRAWSRSRQAPDIALRAPEKRT
jgi:hypothetical protein